MAGMAGQSAPKALSHTSERRARVRPECPLRLRSRDRSHCPGERNAPGIGAGPFGQRPLLARRGRAAYEPVEALKVDLVVLVPEHMPNDD